MTTITRETQAKLLEVQPSYGSDNVTVRYLVRSIGRYRARVWRVEGCGLETTDYSKRSDALAAAIKSGRKVYEDTDQF